MVDMVIFSAPSEVVIKGRAFLQVTVAWPRVQTPWQLVGRALPQKRTAQVPNCVDTWKSRADSGRVCKTYMTMANKIA